MAEESNDSVVLFKAPSEGESQDEDAYSNLFRTSGFQVTLIPVLDFEFVNLDELLVKLKNPDNYEGIIFTSPRCATAVQLSVQNEDGPSVLEKWQNHKHFAVGEKTAQAIQKFNFVANGKEAGNAKNLADFMSQGHYEKQFLYPKGSLTKDTFKSLLKEKCISVDDITVYRTRPHPDLERNIANIKSLFSRTPIYFLYFSPSGINFTFPLLEKHQFDLNQIRFIAIGQTTEAELKENGLTVAGTAAKPDPQLLLCAILDYKGAEMQK